MQSMLNATQLAEYLGVSISTISSYIKKGIIIPDNIETWKIDGEYRVTGERAKEIKQSLFPDGLSVRETVEYVGGVCKSHHVHKAIKEKRLNAIGVQIGTRTNYYVQKDELLEAFKESMNEKRQMTYYDPKRRLYLYQSFFHSDPAETIRIMDIDHLNGYASSQTGEKFTLDDVVTFKMKYAYHSGNYINIPGTINFSFSTPSSVNDLTYTFIEIVIQQIGLRNVSIQHLNETIRFFTKPFAFIKGDMDNSLYDRLLSLSKSALTKGDMIQRSSDVVFTSDDKRIELIVSSARYEQLETLAKSTNQTVEDYLVTKLDTIVGPEGEE